MDHFFGQLTLFGVVGYTVQITLLMVAISHWLEFMSLRRDAPALCEDEMIKTFAYLRDRPVSDWRKLARSPQFVARLGGERHPLAAVVQSVLERPAWLASPELWREVLDLEIDNHLGQLEASAGKIRSVAPNYGLFFTIVGVMLASMQFAETASIKQMLGAVGPAFGTTALGALVAIVEKNLLEGRLQLRQSMLYRTGTYLLLEIVDIYHDQPRR